jgi:superfamily II DNA or RNA helicase
MPPRRSRWGGPPQPANKEPQLPYWERELREAASPPQSWFAMDDWDNKRQLVFAIHPEQSRKHRSMVLRLLYRERRKTGDWKALRQAAVRDRMIDSFSDPLDRQILSLLSPARSVDRMDLTNLLIREIRELIVLPGTLPVLLPLLMQSGRFLVELEAGHHVPVALDETAWQLQLRVSRTGADYAITAECRHQSEEPAELEFVDANTISLGAGYFLQGPALRCLTNAGDARWLEFFARQHRLFVPGSDKNRLSEALHLMRDLPAVESPAELRIRVVDTKPKAWLRIDRREGSLRGELRYIYGESIFHAADDERRGETKEGVLVRRDPVREEEFRRMVEDLGASWVFIRIGPNQMQRRFLIPDPRLTDITTRLLGDPDWIVELDGQRFREASNFRLEVKSGINWFDLSGGVDFGDQHVSLPQILEAVDKHLPGVRLADGGWGILPEQWLLSLGQIPSVGERGKETIRFRRTHVGLLDALLASRPEIRVDATLAKIRRELQRFDGLEPAEQPEGFVGELRGYQKQGLSWFHFLQRFGFGGCLADDMGTGKTAQVLALLEERRALRAKGKLKAPSLAVVPKSLVFNWIQEAANFTPQLRLLDFTGANRSLEDFAQSDLVITTYGTLIRVAPKLQDFEFDYIILDEAQNIRNPDTASAKAARLLTAEHRLALTGTPVENHLGDWWSIFAFLNPGIASATQGNRMARSAGKDLDDGARAQLARALRPYLLRRTKEKVAPELPPRTEQTIWCPLEGRQRELYDELLRYYRANLLEKVDREGLNRNRMNVLEALLRLRQMACHPGLLGQKAEEDLSSKFSLLIPRLQEIVSEGHKALVFSQFTSLLALLRKELDALGLSYEYLDGKTKDRKAAVTRFQEDPECGLFLISLKAGGTGLNLTAAEYVFLLDPWWNPAVEAQAIDRSHRIGQTRSVFACRLIASNTVEEKVLELQKSKRALADAIIGGSAADAPLRNLTREDLELLLS